LAIFMLLVLFASITSLAQTEPTKEETIEWLKESLPTKATYTGRSEKAALTDIVRDVAFDGCVCKMTTVSVTKIASFNNTTTTKYSFSFANIESARIEVVSKTDFNPAHLSLLLHTIGDRETVAMEYDLGIRRPSGTTHQTKMVGIAFDDKDTAE